MKNRSNLLVLFNINVMSLALVILRSKKLFFLILTLLCFITVKSQSWYEANKTVAFDRAADDEFGYSVSIDGDYAIVGAWMEDEDSAGANTFYQAGSAYIFKKDSNGNWTELQKLHASDREGSDYFGTSVSISGSYAIVGAYSEDHDTQGYNSLPAAGSAYIFEKDGSGVWNEVQKIVASDRAASDYFGESVSISGNYAIVGVRYEDHDTAGANSLTDAGSAYIFERDGSGNWAEVQKIVASDRAVNDYFGISVFINGTYAIVGAYKEDEDTSGANSLTDPGSAYIFERDGSGVWNEVQKIVASDRAANDIFGCAVSISGDYAIVGAKWGDFDATGANSLSNAGSAYIFERNGSGNWAEVQKIVASDRIANDIFGESVSISGNYAIVGAGSQDLDETGGAYFFSSGAAYIFERDGSGNWTEVQKIVASDRYTSDVFGSSVSISGNNIIVAAYNEDEDSAGENTLNASGSAYIFEYYNTASGSGNWSTVLSGTGITTNVIIPNGNSVTVDGSQSCLKLTVESGGSITVPITYKLNVRGALILNSTSEFTNEGITTVDNNVIIKSDSTGTGSLVDKGTFTVGGTSTVELYLTKNRWWYVSHPVTVTSSAVFDANGGTHRLYWWNESVSGTNGWNEITSTNISLETTMFGYACKYTDTAKTLKFTGILATGDQSITKLTYTAGAPNYNGFNLVGNPYPSALDWGLNGNTWTAQTNVSTSIWYRNNGSFATYNSSGGTSTNGGQRYIPAMQGFWVKVDAGTIGTLTSNNASRVHNSQVFYKNENQNSILRLTVQRKNFSDDIIIGFFDDANNYFDSYDTEKMFATDENYPQLYTKVEEKQLAVNGLSHFTESLVVPLGFKTDVSGEFSLSASDFEYIDSEMDVFLEDFHTGKLIDLKELSYSFNSNSVNNIDRFAVHFIKSSTRVDFEHEENINIYSFKNNIYIRNNLESGSVIIYDIVGKTLLTRKLQNINDNKICLNVPNGFYLVKVLSNKQVYSKKVYINK